MQGPIALSDEQNRLIQKHLQLVLKANETTNLTRIQSEEEAELLHVEDSLQGIPECLEAPSGRYADLGTGGGFPGFAIAIATGRDTVLVESVGKKADLLELFASKLNLTDSIHVYHGRAEELAAQSPESFALVTARALTAMPSLIELASPLLVRGGRLVSYKADKVDEELEWAISIQDRLGMEMISDRKLMLSDGCTSRRIIVFEKVSEPKVKLPRRSGMAQKRPYKAK